MKRRAFVGAVGSLASLGVIGYTTRPPVGSIDVRVWFSEAASAYDRLEARIREYLGFALEFGHWRARITFGGSVPVSTEDGARVTIHGEWPAMVGAGALGRGPVDPVADVNLLVTDGQMRTAPTGYGLPHVASVGGARFVDRLEPLVGDPGIVENRTPARVVQILIHEVGHALGLDHEHGVAFRKGSAVVATPMLSAYAWDPSYDLDRSACGTAYPDTDGLERKLTFSYSACAQRQLERYQGGVTRWRSNSRVGVEE
ncbi:peptidase M10A and M12B matrixin and adamalysin [Natronobiforma cellulositropha]|uniref:peptidase M10A and M12B matrixin and adamalysin n=1 Tax=Natronobiforma cellulositropha TaxID=1679076 RepID=UPI0021D57069|nr:peptidase M10A and M12B matrixin and adamalysin [Natronobiforma cellulositropha]